MRRSGAPSQLSGNAMKKPRFLPPASSTFCPLAEPKPLSPKPGLSNTLQKVLFFFFYIIYYMSYFLLVNEFYFIFSFF